MMLKCASLIAVIIAMYSQSSLAACEFDSGFDQTDDDGKSSVRVAVSDAALLYGGSIHVNTDGTKRSYKVADFWGWDDALNNLCNAMKDKCDGVDLSARRKLTQRAKADGWPSDELAATKIDPKIIPFAGGKPCPEVDGFLVSATALNTGLGSDECDPKGYVDSLAVPAIVIPGTARFGELAKVGDLAAILGPDRSTVFFAVVGDTGPKREIGEASLALNREILGKDHDPKNYLEVRGQAIVNGKKVDAPPSWDVGSAWTIIFRGSANAEHPYITRERINAAGALALKQWGGAEELAACAAEYQAGHF